MAILKHIAISLDDISERCRKSNMPVSQAFGRCFQSIITLMQMQTELDVRVMTIYLLPDYTDKSASDYIALCDSIADCFEELPKNTIVSGQSIKISILGKWYKLPGRTVEALKNAMEATKEHSRFFVNFCISYDGQEEIVDACKLIAKQVGLGKLDPEMITRDMIKENTYSSYLSQPDAILIYGERKLSGLLLWDSANARIVFADKSFMEFEKHDLIELNHNLFK